jgi:putative transposase
MTLVREVLPGWTYLMSRRCLERRCLIRPDRPVTQAILYAYGYATAQYEVDLHAFMALSNHHHPCATDRGGVLPDFMHCVDLLVAKFVNAYRGRWECLWTPGSYSAVRLETPEDVLAKIVYVQANPVAAGLVSHAKDWTGASSVGWRFGETRIIERPDGYFDPCGAMPEKVKLTLVRPPGFDGRSNEELDRLVAERLRERETELRAERRTRGPWFMGMPDVMRCNPNDAPGTREPRRVMNPRIAARDPDVRVAAIAARQGFLDDYRTAYRAWTAGNHDVVFPAGTWLMRVRHAASCRPPPPS